MKFATLPARACAPQRSNTVVAKAASKEMNPVARTMLAGALGLSLCLGAPAFSQELSYQWTPPQDYSELAQDTSFYDDLIGSTQINSVAVVEECPTQVIELPPGLPIIVKEGDVIKVDQPLTTNPNAGGFGQTETEIVVQDPNRLYLLFLFVFAGQLGQVALIVKKKQYERLLLAGNPDPKELEKFQK